jgi:tRNA threonylcarbamoyl adenosine modification protein YeaZ
MLLLALDTAAAAVSVALHDGHKALATRASASSPRHAELLIPLVSEALTEVGATPSDLTGVVVGVGPGPFTGLRVGLVTARALGLALGIDVLGVCSLDAVAAGAARGGLPAGEFLVATDARRREVYWARYRIDGADDEAPPVRIDGPYVAAAADVPRDGLPVAGRGAQLYPDELGDAAAPLDPPAAELAALAVIGPPHLLPAEPLYLRRPDASSSGVRKRVLP